MNRWQAVVEVSEQGGFQARAQLHKGKRMVAEEVCTHQHGSANRARACANRLIERQGRMQLGDRLAL